MLLDSGILTLCEKINTSQAGLMPSEKLSQKTQMYYGIRTVGYSRQYAALSVGQMIDMLVRVQFNPHISAGMYAILEDGEQYRIDLVQHVEDDSDRLKMTDLTLSRLKNFYDLAQE